MSYRRRALGQVVVPGQVNFATLPPGRTRMPGLPMPGYIQYGSDVTGEPDIYLFGRDPYRGLGQGLLTSIACSDSALNQQWTTQTQSLINAGSLASGVGGLVAGIIGAVTKNPIAGGLIGAGVGYGCYAVWTAPYRV